MYEVPGDVSPGPCGEKTQRKKNEKKRNQKSDAGSSITFGETSPLQKITSLSRTVLVTQ